MRLLFEVVVGDEELDWGVLFWVGLFMEAMGFNDVMWIGFIVCHKSDLLGVRGGNGSNVCLSSWIEKRFVRATFSGANDYKSLLFSLSLLFGLRG